MANADKWMIELRCHKLEQEEHSTLSIQNFDSNHDFDETELDALELQ